MELLLLAALVCCLLVFLIQPLVVKAVQKPLAVLYAENMFPEQFSCSFYLLRLLVQEHFPPHKLLEELLEFLISQ